MAALIAAGVITLLVIDWNMLRSTVNERASAASGRHFEIAGDLSIDIWSWTPEVVAHDVAFGNAPWASEPDMLRISEVYLKLRLLPILAGRLEVEQLRLVKPEVALERKDGVANWDLKGETASEVALEAAAPTEREDFPVLKSLEIEAAVFRFRHPDLDEPIEVRLDSLSLQAGGFEDPVRLKAEGTYQDQAFTLEGQGESFEKFRSTTETYDLVLDARIGNTHLAAEGSMEDPVTLAGIDAALALEGETLTELFEILALPLPASPPYAFSGRLTRDEDHWALHEFEGRFGESDLRGDLQAFTGGERIRIIADVESGSFRTEDLAGFWGEVEEKDGREATGDDHILSDEPISLPKLRRMDAEVRFHGKAVQSGPLQLEDLSADLELNDGLLTIQPLELGLATGRIAADLHLDGRGEIPQMAGDVKVEGLDLDALLSLFGLEDAGAGRLQGRLKMTMQGGSLRELGASAEGEGALIMSGGRIENLLLELLALDLQEAAEQWLTGDESQVEVLCLAMPTRIESGRFEAQPWILDTTDALVVISGFVDLDSQLVDIELKPYPKDFSLFNYLTSIEIQGNLAERSASANALEAAGKLVLKTLAAPFMPMFSSSIQDAAEEQSVPCESLRQQLESAMAEGDVGVEPAETAAPSGNSGGADPESDAVARIQSALNEAGFDLVADGIMGPNTEAALREFQRRRNLAPSGRPDAETLHELGISAAAE